MCVVGNEKVVAPFQVTRTGSSAIDSEGLRAPLAVRPRRSARGALRQPVFQIGAGERAAQVVALAHVAAEHGQQVAGRLILDPFCHHGEAKPVP